MHEAGSTTHAEDGRGESRVPGRVRADDAVVGCYPTARVLAGRRSARRSDRPAVFRTNGASFSGRDSGRCSSEPEHRVSRSPTRARTAYASAIRVSDRSALAPGEAWEGRRSVGTARNLSVEPSGPW